MAKNNTKLRGFASMDKERHREIASRGGRSAHEQGVAHKFNSKTGRIAGKKGGRATRALYKKLSTEAK